MSDLHIDIVNKNFAPFFLRVPLGFYALLEGYWWSTKIEMLSRMLEDYFLMSQGTFLTIFSYIAPFLFMFAGILLILGLWSTFGALLIVVALLVPLGFSGIFTLGGDIMTRRNTFKTVVMMFAAFSLLVSGPGALSLDQCKRKNH